MRKKEVKKDNNCLVDLPSNHSFYGIDLMKFICAILVCAIHIRPFYVVESFARARTFNFYIQQYLCRIAVPFFFVVAGFFLFRKIDFDNVDFEVIKKYSFKIFRLFGMWYALLFVGSKWHLWYLPTLGIAVWFVAFIIKYKIKARYFIPVIIIFYIIGLLYDSYNGVAIYLSANMVFKKVTVLSNIFFKSCRTALFFGLPFVGMGAVFAKKRISIKPSVSFILFCVSMLLFLGEAYFLRHLNVNNHPFSKDRNLYIMLIPTVFFLFHFCASIRLKPSDIWKKLRILSMLIFYLHLFVYYFVLIALNMFKRHFSINMLGYTFLISMFLILVLSIIIERLSQKEKFSWLKYLYS